MKINNSTELHDLYSSKYFDNVPGLIDEQEQQWKFTIIVPYIDKFVKMHIDSKINLLDVGSGAGIILRKTADYLKNKSKLVEKNTIDTTDDMLEIQKRNNPDLKRSLIADISKKTKFKEKEVDLCLLIDVLEHVEDINSALKEIRRIAKFAVIKIPLEKSLLLKGLNLSTNNKYRKDSIARLGHVQYLNSQDIISLIKKHLGEPVLCGHPNVASFILERKRYKTMNPVKKMLYVFWYSASNLLYKISPKANTSIFFDYYVILVKCK